MVGYRKMAALVIEVAAVVGVLSGLAGIAFVCLTLSSEPEGYLQRLVTGIGCLVLGLALHGISRLVACCLAEQSNPAVSYHSV